MKYIEKKTLAQRGTSGSSRRCPVSGLLLIGITSVVDFEQGHTRHGYDLVTLFPAVHGGKRCWFVEKTWTAADGYCGIGTEEKLIPFDEGVKILIAEGAYQHMFPEQDSGV